MKRLLISAILCVALLFAGNAMAASSMAVKAYAIGNQGSMLVIQLTCTAHTDGTFDAKTVTAAEVGYDYHKSGYYFLDASAINSATDDHTNAAVVTITDGTTRQIIGATVGDTLTLSQTASAVAYASMARGASQRAVYSPLVVSIADTGSTATVQTLYLILGR